MAVIGTWQIVGLVAGSSVLAAALNHLVSVGARWRNRRQDRDFGRLYLALALEDYSSKCGEAISASEIYEHSDQHAGSAQVNIPPLPPYPENVDWKALGLSETNALFSFRAHVETIRATLRELVDHDLDGVIEDARRYSADVGVRALEIAASLRKDAGTPLATSDFFWSNEEYLASKQEEFRKKRSNAASSIAPPEDEPV